MNLLTKTSLLITTVALTVLMAGGVIFFLSTKEMINKQVDKELISEMHFVMRSFDNLVHGRDTVFYEELTIIPTDEIISPVARFRDTIRLNVFDNKYHTYRALFFGFRKGGNNYKIEIFKSLIDSNTLIERVTLVWIGMSLFLIVAIYFLNKLIFKSTWKDFFEILKLAKSYDLKKPHKKVLLKESEINEFASLNTVITQLLERVERDFNNQKELTANTSHELQTPLSIIRMKAELLLQTPDLTSEQVRLISDILATTDRLSRLNKSLLTISKIENNQFRETEKISLHEKIRSLAGQFKELIDEKGLKISMTLEETTIEIHPLLADLLLVNLLGNAILHNPVENGRILLELKNNILKIANTGDHIELDKENIFHRYFRQSKNPGSTGIGLSIVKKICEYYDIDLDYRYRNNLHTFILDLSSLYTS
ncbi:MAG: HAMP domain-containing histidine kinase [Bacteroidales bacterium]|nr:HAMP domain-containing histidine kinase [Bacteroidales bacterium]